MHDEEQTCSCTVLGIRDKEVENGWMVGVKFGEKWKKEKSSRGPHVAISCL